MIMNNTGIEAIGDIIAGFAMVLWVVLLVSPAVAMAAVVVGKKWNELNRKRIGAELEMILKIRRDEGGNHHSLAHWLSIKGIRTRTAEYNSESSTDETKVQPDSSVDGNGFELVSPVLYDGNHSKWLKQCLTALNGLTSSSVSAGYHVHIGLKDFETSFGDDGQLTRDEAYAILGRVIWAYGYFETGFDLMVSRSRRDGSGMSVSMGSMKWANDLFPHHSLYNHESRREVWNGDGYDTEVHPVSPQSRFKELGAWSSDRYQKVNPCSIRKHGTIEFRQHQCINADHIKAARWADLCFDFVNRCVDEDSLRNITDYQQSINGLFDWLGFASSDTLRNYWLKRSLLVNGRSLNQPCSTCGSTRCMLDNNCPTSTDVRQQQYDNNRDFKQLATDIQRPTTMCCHDCGTDIYTSDLYGVEFDEDSLTWHADLGYAGYECRDFTGNDCDGQYFSMSAIGLGLMLMFPMMTTIALLVGCGIGAIHGASKAFNVKSKFKLLWSKLSNRGSQAAGFAYEDGQGVKYLKAAESSVALAHNANRYLTKQTQWVMCHTRFATHGTNDDNNAHPHFDSTGTLTLVHNGVVDNYLDAWAKLSVPQTGEVDSMAVAQALYDGGIEKVVELCEGSMSLIWSDAREPTGTLKCWTNGGNPLHMGRLDDKETGAVVIASTEQHLTQTFGKRLVNHWAAIIGREYTIHPDGSITRRDIEGSAETYDNRFSRHWSTYGTYLTTKATGNDDNCTIPANSGLGETDWAHELKDKRMDEWGGWPAMTEIIEGATYDLHGYDMLSNEGIRPNGTRYDLPQYFDPFYWSDADDLLQGRLDPYYLWDDLSYYL